jgi:hypothetical protein
MNLNLRGGISEQNLGTGQINPLTLSNESPHCENMMSKWSKWIKGRTVDYWIVHPQDCGQLSYETCVDGPEMLARSCFVYMLSSTCLHPVMSTKRAYRAILRELYKAVCILPHPISCFLPLCVSSQLAPGLHEVGQLRRTCVLFSSPPSPVTLTTTRKMSSRSYVLSACTR